MKKIRKSLILVLSMLLLVCSTGLVSAADSSDIEVGDTVTVAQELKGYSGELTFTVYDKIGSKLILVPESVFSGNGKDADALIAFDADGEPNERQTSATDWERSDAEAWCNSFANAIANDGWTVKEVYFPSSEIEGCGVAYWLSTSSEEGKVDIMTADNTLGTADVTETLNVRPIVEAEVTDAVKRSNGNYIIGATPIEAINLSFSYPVCGDSTETPLNPTLGEEGYEVVSAWADGTADTIEGGETYKVNLTITPDAQHYLSEDAEITLERADGSNGVLEITEQEINTFEGSVVIKIQARHPLEEVAAKEPTCTEDGNRKHYVCTSCGALLISSFNPVPGNVVLPKLGHKWTYSEVKPTCTEKGYLEATCTRDSSHKEIVRTTDAIGHDWGKWTYVDGSVIRVCKNDSTHIDRLNVSTSAPLIATVKSSGKKGLKISWNAINGVTKYTVMLDNKAVATTTNTSYTAKGLKKNSVHMIVVIGTADHNGEEVDAFRSPVIYGATAGKYTNPTSVSVSKKKVTLKVGKSFKVKPKINNKKKLVKKTARARYISTNSSVATVSNGKIKAHGKGTCKVYVYAVNGAKKVIKVTVK